MEAITRSKVSKTRLLPQVRKLAPPLGQQAFRHTIQAGFALFILFVTVQHVLAGENAATTVPSPEAYCPLGGLETLYRYVTSGGKFVPHAHLSNLVLLAAVFLTAILARSAFCGWVCPLGFLQDMAGGFSGFIQKRIPLVEQAVKGLKSRWAPLAVIDRPLRLLKYGVLAWAVGGAALYTNMVFRDYDPWAALINITEISIRPGLFVLGILILASFFVQRPWCRYACPLGAVSGLMGWLSPVRVKREASLCKSCAVCSKACPMGLPVHKANTVTSPDCTGCLECVAACPRKGALELKVEMPVAGIRKHQ